MKNCKIIKNNNFGFYVLPIIINLKILKSRNFFHFLDSIFFSLSDNLFFYFLLEKLETLPPINFKSSC